jgi:hypothetical protein
MALITWEQSSLRWRHEDTDLEGSVDGLEGEATSFPFPYTCCGILVFNILLACEDCTGETTREI